MALYKSFAIYINQIFQEFWLRRGLNNLNAQRNSIVCDLDLKGCHGLNFWANIDQNSNFLNKIWQKGLQKMKS